MPVTPVVILSDVATSEPGKRVAVLAVKGFEKYAQPVQYWAELKNEPTATEKPGYGSTLAAKWLAKEAARFAPAMVADGLQRRQVRLDALPAVPAPPEEDPHATERATLTTEIAELTALKAIVDADAVPRIDAFYSDLLALIGASDPCVEQYTKEWNETKAPFVAGPALPAEL